MAQSGLADVMPDFGGIRRARGEAKHHRSITRPFGLAIRSQIALQYHC